MDWTALWLSLRLAGWTVVILLPVAVFLGRFLAWRDFAGKGVAEAAIAIPLVLPPTVLGFYMLVAFGANSPVGRFWNGAFGHQLVFTFEGLLLASVIFNLPFAIQPAQRGFEAIPPEVREAAMCCGMSPLRALWRVELPLAWPGLMTAMVLTFAHTLGEFGIVLMVGGSIPGETRTIAISIYDRVQAFDTESAGIMAGVLLAISLVTISLTFWLSRRVGRRLG
ncbi:molybdate ABC transporter permease subunit (plasmid) [Cereibacter azotoformans]|uniref:molybdate ABC transporter permease subunit n=1 Tax=Cereibacter azotoformans TaxID=43057 RepID=UPI001EEA4317|nr:molybdate ABC transporter permease subunit [Cereibacter azotoformans]ULB12453.1 molybdate ABC transporter permease subunit [Cereibacter azotoformans]